MEKRWPIQTPERKANRSSPRTGSWINLKESHRFSSNIKGGNVGQGSFLNINKAGKVTLEQSFQRREFWYFTLLKLQQLRTWLYKELRKKLLPRSGKRMRETQELSGNSQMPKKRKERPTLKMDTKSFDKCHQPRRRPKRNYITFWQTEAKRAKWRIRPERNDHIKYAQCILWSRYT